MSNKLIISHIQTDPFFTICTSHDKALATGKAKNGMAQYISTDICAWNAKAISSEKPIKMQMPTHHQGHAPASCTKDFSMGKQK